MTLVFGLGECPECGERLTGLTHGCDVCGWTPDDGDGGDGSGEDR